MKNLSVLSMALAVSFLSVSAHAESFNLKCVEVSACATAVGELLGQKYLLDPDLKGKVAASGNLELTHENAELLFTSMLNLLGYSRVPLDHAGTFQIMRQRDARDSAIPFAVADKSTAPQLPDNWDLYTLRYKATHPDSVEHIARLSRSFMPANSRIIPDELSGMLYVTDTALNIKKLYELIREGDLKPTPALLKKWDEEAKASQARAHAHQMEADSAPVPSPKPAGHP
jgi:general secretion pathway protein D